MARLQPSPTAANVRRDSSASSVAAAVRWKKSEMADACNIVARATAESSPSARARATASAPYSHRTLAVVHDADEPTPCEHADPPARQRRLSE